MKYIKLGNSDLHVSKLCLGCLSFGHAKVAGKPWLLDQNQTDEVVKRALELGINFFDTANYYNEGTSEMYLGHSIKKLVKREDVIIATKVYYNEGGLSREAIFREVDSSLKKLQMDYIDLLIIHRWDYNTPIEETMKALHDVIESGKVRYIGASAMFAFQFLKAQEVARQNGWHTFISMQNHYNLIYREDERELIKLLEEENVHMTPYSPLAAGRLSRLWDNGSVRFQTDQFPKLQYEKNKEMDYVIVERVHELAKKYNVSMAQIALAWLFSKKMMASPVIGVTKMKHLEEAYESIHMKLTDEDMEYLEELYQPHPVSGAH